MRVRFRKEGADPACGLMPSLPSPRPASSVCDRGSSTGSSSPQGPMLNAILCARHPEILNHFISEPVFCKRSPMGQDHLGRMFRLKREEAWVRSLKEVLGMMEILEWGRR